MLRLRQSKFVSHQNRPNRYTPIGGAALKALFFHTEYWYCGTLRILKKTIVSKTTDFASLTIVASQGSSMGDSTNIGYCDFLDSTLQAIAL